MQQTSNQRGMGLSRQEIEAISREVALHVTASPPLEVLRQPTGIHLRHAGTDGFPAIINGGSNPYSWSEVFPHTAGAWQVPAVARSGTTSINPAYEINSITKVPSGTHVRMWPAFFNYSSAGQEYVFEYDGTSTGGGGGSSATSYMRASDRSQAQTQLSAFQNWQVPLDTVDFLGGSDITFDLVDQAIKVNTTGVYQYGLYLPAVVGVPLSQQFAPYFYSVYILVSGEQRPAGQAFNLYGLDANHDCSLVVEGMSRLLAGALIEGWVSTEGTPISVGFNPFVGTASHPPYVWCMKVPGST